MYCRNCGRQLPDGTQFCTQCGAQQGAAPNYGYAQQPQYGYQNREPKPSVGFLEAVKLYFTNYINFNDRSRRSEYWWATLAIYLLGLVIGSVLPDLAMVWSLVTLLPGLGLAVRRLHDIGKSGWFYLLNLIPLVGQIILIVWFCKDSAPDNQWGPNPKY